MSDIEKVASRAGDPRLLKALLLIGGCFCLIAGPIQFFFPGIDAVLAEVEPGELDWIYRMLGSGYIGVGIGMLGVYRNPAGQGVFVSMLITITALAIVTFTIALLTAPYAPILLVLCLWILIFLLLVFARHRASDILYGPMNSGTKPPA